MNNELINYTKNTYRASNVAPEYIACAGKTKPAFAPDDGEVYRNTRSEIIHT